MLEYSMLAARLVDRLNQKLGLSKSEDFGEFFTTNFVSVRDVVCELSWNARALLAGDPDITFTNCQFAPQFGESKLTAIWIKFGGSLVGELVEFSPGLTFDNRDEQINFYACSNLLWRVWTAGEPRQTTKAVQEAYKASWREFQEQDIGHWLY